jgi:hypothetical protein
MTGFIGVRAKRKRRNIIIFFILTIIFFLFFYIIPVFKLTETIPSDTLLPSPDDAISSEILTIEELELKIFDRDQKIIFHNNELKKIKEELKILVNENTQLSDSIIDSKNQLSLTSSNNEDFKNLKIQLEKIQKDNKKELQRLNDIILKITNEKNDLIKSIEIVSSEKELSKKEYKIIVNKNMQLISLKDLLEKKIKEQTSLIDELNLSIETLNLSIETIKDSYQRR